MKRREEWARPEWRQKVRKVVEQVAHPGGVDGDPVEIEPGVAGESRAEVVLQHRGEAFERDERRFEVVRGDVGELLERAVAAFERAG